MSEQRTQEIKDRLFQLDRKIRPLEWDATRNQINDFKRQDLQRLKDEHKILTDELLGLQQQPL
ncbi:hypothetical protein HYX14_01300 [Candidatus Woesearchaeota archaeon]|nr:hypothetical protein [Candidatus Woesearchaeota archaeon]